MGVTVLIHSSKTMRSCPASPDMTTPLLMDKATPLVVYLRSLSVKQLQAAMSISGPLAEKVHSILADWNTTVDKQSLAIDSFVGDIYSGLQASKLSDADRDYTQEHL